MFDLDDLDRDLGEKRPWSEVQRVGLRMDARDMVAALDAIAEAEDPK
jgi:hypothetical protein